MAKRKKGASKEVCIGCVCKRIAENSEVPLSDVCIGIPIVLDMNDNEVGRCPCEKCVVKTMCQDMCVVYTVYTELVRGDITYEEYSKWKGK